MVYVSFLQFKEQELEQNVILAKVWSSLLSGVPPVQGYSTSDSAEMLISFRDKVWEQVLRNFLGFDRKYNGGSYVEGTIILMTTVDAWVPIMVHCEVEKKNHGGHRLK